MLPPPPPIPPEQISGDRHSLTSVLIIAAILAFAVLAIASIHFLLQYLSRSRNPNFVAPLSSSSSTSSSSMTSSPDSDRDLKAVIDSLPLFSLSSSAAVKSSSSLDCAVCLSPFEPRDELRLLPACRHAFHSKCIDTWLQSTMTCPLCRSSITAADPPPDPAGSESFRLEIGSVSRRTASSADEPAAHVRNYSLGSSFEYLVEEEVEAVVERIRRPEKSGDLTAPLPPPGEAVAEMAGNGSRSWLREYVDRLASSASSSFSSLRRSRRFESGSGSGSGSGGVVGSAADWDLEGNLHLQLEEEDGGFSSFYRWLVGA